MSEIGMFRQVESVLRYTSQPQGEFHARIERSGAAHFFAALGTNRSCLLYVRSRQPEPKANQLCHNCPAQSEDSSRQREHATKPWLTASAWIGHPTLVPTFTSSIRGGTRSHAIKR